MAREVVERAAGGDDVDEAEQGARSSASCEARSIALSSIAFSGLRLAPGSAAARSRPTARMSASEAEDGGHGLDDIVRLH